MLAQPQLLQSSIGRALTDEEAQSLKKVLNARTSELDVLGSLDKDISGLKKDVMQFLDAASHRSSSTTSLDVVEGAMLLMEQAHVLAGSTHSRAACGR